jgi:hypothetical protein
MMMIHYSCAALSDHDEIIYPPRPRPARKWHPRLAYPRLYKRNKREGKGELATSIFEYD